MATADGAGVEVSVANAVDAFISGAKDAGVWDSIHASCVLAGARTLAGALVPLRNEGPEIVDIDNLPTPVISDGNGSCGQWNAATRTGTNECIGAAGSVPVFQFPFELSESKSYRVSGRLSGDLSDMSSTGVRLGTSGLLSLDTSTGVISGTATPAGAATKRLLIYIDPSLAPTSFTIESLSIREVIAAPTNVANGFVEGDYDRQNGLTGDGATTYLDSGRANDADPQNDNHVAAYVTAGYVAVPNGSLIGAQNTASSYTMTGTVSYNRSSTANTALQVTSAGLYASSRETQASFLYKRPAGDVQTFAANSAVPSGLSNNVFVYGYANTSGSLVSPTDATISFYSIGTSLSLEDLDTLVTNLITAIGEAL
jgi:hypothetical protein